MSDSKPKPKMTPDQLNRILEQKGISPEIALALMQRGFTSQQQGQQQFPQAGGGAASSSSPTNSAAPKPGGKFPVPSSPSSPSSPRASQQEDQKTPSVKLPASKMRGANQKLHEPAMDFLVRLAEVNNAAHAAMLQMQHRKTLETRRKMQLEEYERQLLEDDDALNNNNDNNENGDSSSNNVETPVKNNKPAVRKPPPPLPPAPQLPDLSRLLDEIDMAKDRRWGIANVPRGVFFLVHILCILLFTIFVPWSIVAARNSEVSFWALQSVASWSRGWVDRTPSSSSSSSSSRTELARRFDRLSTVTDPIPSTTFAVSGNAGVAEVFHALFDMSEKLPSAWIPVGSLVFSIAMADPAAALCPTTIAPVPTPSSGGARKISCMPYDISTSSGLSESSSYTIQGIDFDPARTRINIAPVPASLIEMEGDLMCLGSTCAPDSFRQVGWSFPSVNRYPRDSSSFIKWRIAAPMNSTSWMSRDQFAAASSSSSSRKRSLYYFNSAGSASPLDAQTVAHAKDAITNLVTVPGPYVALAMAELAVFDTSTDSLIYIGLGFETEGGAGTFAGKIQVSAFALGDDARSIALRTFSIMFSVCLLAYAVLAPVLRVYLVKDVTQCSGCTFAARLCKRPFKTVSYAPCVECKEPVLVKGPRAFRCDSCQALQPAAEHHRCWRSALCEPGWLLSFSCGLCGLLWGGSDGVTLGHLSDFLAAMQSQVNSNGASFLTLRNLSNLINQHQRGFGAAILLLAALNAQRVFWHLLGGKIGLAWLAQWRRAAGIIAALLVLAVTLATLASWSVGLPDYRGGAAQGSVTESFYPPGINFTWGQSVVWWIGRLLLLALAAFALALCVSTPPSKAEGDAQSTYDPDWASVVLCWTLLKERMTTKTEDEDDPGMQETRAIIERARKRREEEEAEKKKKEEQDEGGGRSDNAESSPTFSNNNNTAMSRPSAEAAAAVGGNNGSSPSSSPQQLQQQQSQRPKPRPRDQVDRVLDEVDQEEELSADPLTRAVDKIERMVSNLMMQLPPILEDAIDERVHFSLMEQSRHITTERREQERHQEQQHALSRLENLRQAEWHRQAQELDRHINYDDDGAGTSDEDEDDVLFAGLGLKRTRQAEFLQSGLPGGGGGGPDEDEDEEDQFVTVEASSSAVQRRPLLRKSQSSASPPGAAGAGGGASSGGGGGGDDEDFAPSFLELEPEQMIAYNNEQAAKEKRKEHQQQRRAANAPAPPPQRQDFKSTQFGRGRDGGGSNNSASPPSAASSSSPNHNNHSRLPRVAGSASPTAAGSSSSARPDFREFADLDTVNRVADREHLLNNGYVPPEMEYISHAQQMQQQPPQRFIDDNNFANNLQQQISSSAAPAPPAPAVRPGQVGSHLRTAAPSDYHVEHLLDDDEVDDIEARRSGARQQPPPIVAVAENGFSAAPRQQEAQQDQQNYSPQQQPTQFMPTPSENQNQHQQNQNQNEEEHQLPFGRYSGLPPSQIFHARHHEPGAAAEARGRGHQPPPHGGGLDLPQPGGGTGAGNEEDDVIALRSPISLMRPRHY